MALNLLIPRGEKHARYNPTRDLAYTWQHVCAAAFDGLDNPDRWDAMFAGYLKKSGVSNEDILNVARAYARFMAAVKSDRHCKSIEDALTQAGLFQEHPAALGAFMMRLGQVMTGLWYMAIRDVEGEFGLPINENRLIEEVEKGADYVGKRMAAMSTAVRRDT